MTTKKRTRSARKVRRLVRRSGWAVWSRNGHVCINEESMPAIFTHRSRAIEFRDALIPHIGKCKVIRVEITVSSNKAVSNSCKDA